MQAYELYKQRRKDGLPHNAARKSKVEVDPLVSVNL